MKYRWVAFAVFIAFVSLISWYNAPSAIPSVAAYIALREVPLNTRITRDHWRFNQGSTPVASWGLPKPEELLGRYALNMIASGQPIRPDQLAESPRLRAEPDTALLGFDTSDLGFAAPLLNAGATVYVCDKENLSCPGGPYLVQAVLGRPEVPFAVIRATLREEAELRKITKPKLRLAGLP